MEIELSRAIGLLDSLGKKAWRDGEEITITKKGKPYLKLVAHPDGSSLDEDKQGGTRGIGIAEGDLWVAPELPETSEEIMDAFEGKWSSDFC